MSEVNAREQEVLAEYLQGRENESEGSERDPGEHIQSPVVTDADNTERVDVEECVSRWPVARASWKVSTPDWPK